MLQSHTLNLDDLRIHYVEVPGPGQALLLLHGITGSHATFLPLMPILARQFHVYAMDLRGHAQSDWTTGRYQIADYGSDVMELLRTVIGRPAVIAGHSLGGLIATWLAAHEPDMVSGIFLEDPPLYITYPPRLQTTPFYGFFITLREQLRQHHVIGGTLGDLTALVGQMPINAGQTMLEAVGPEMVQARAIELHQMDPVALDPIIDGKLMSDEHPDTLLLQIRRPIHLLAADATYGGAMDAHDVERFAAMAPHATHTMFTGVGHGIHEERADDYVRALGVFVAAGMAGTEPGPVIRMP